MSEQSLGTTDASCYAHVVARVREITGAELPEDYLVAAASPEKWAEDVGWAMGMLPRDGDVVEMVGDNQTRHLGVMVSPFEMEHLDVRRSQVHRVPLRVVRESGVVVRIVRPIGNRRSDGATT